jgi:hypothetical protein
MNWGCFMKWAGEDVKWVIMVKYNTIYVDAPLELNAEKLNTLPLQGVLDKDALLFLWFPERELKEYLSLLEVWGFRYRRLLTRFKRDLLGDRWNCYPCAHLLVGVRGTVRDGCCQAETLFDCVAEKGGYHPLYIRDRAAEAAYRAFPDPEMLDMFGGYWHRLNEEYDKEEWDFGDDLVKE